jgi:hypothetical protein
VRFADEAFCAEAELMKAVKQLKKATLVVEGCMVPGPLLPMSMLLFQGIHRRGSLSSYAKLYDEATSLRRPEELPRDGREYY